MTTPTPPEGRALVAAAAEGFAQALAAPMTALINSQAAGRGEIADLTQVLLRIALATEGILDRLTPEAERLKVYQVGSYVRSNNKGGDLVWLYATHPGLAYRVATVYSEHFDRLRPFLDPAVGRVFDGEVAPSRDGAVKKGYLQECRRPFEVVLRPTGKLTDAGQMTYDFEAVREIVGVETAATSAPPAEPPPPAAPTPGPAESTNANAVGASTTSTASTAADAEFDAMPSASAGRPPVQPKPPQVGPRVSGGAAPSPAGPQQGTVTRPPGAPAGAAPAGAPVGAADDNFQATLVGEAYQPFSRWEAEFARRYPYYRRAGSEAPDSYRIRKAIYALGRSPDNASGAGAHGSRFAKITLDNLAEVQAALEAHAAAKHPA